MKKMKTLLLSFLLFQALWAQNDTLLIRYRQQALDYQQQIKMAERRLSGAESKVEAARSDLLPHLDLTGKYHYYGVPLKLAPAADGNAVTGEELNNFYSFNLDLYQPIYTGGYLTGVREAAQSEVEMMKSLIDQRKQQVILNSDMAYWQAVSKNEMFRLYTMYREIIGEFLKVIKDRVEEEVVGKNELYQAQVRYNDAEYNTIRSEKEYRVSIMSLNRLIGLPANTPSAVSDTLVTADWKKSDSNLSETALNQRPEIGFYNNLISKNQYTETIVGSKYNPQFGVSAGGKWGSPSPGLNIDPDFNYNFKANLSVPLYYWGKKSEEVFTARQLTEVARLRMEETRDKIKLEVESSYYKLERSQEQLDFARGSLNNAGMNVSVMLDRYNEGLSSVLEVLDAQLYWQKTYLNYILAKFELDVAWSQYLYSMGEFSKMKNN